ncbi:Delta tubulin [Klebsormidium nitens]|uniref:Tubulin delta chain n=1 Tax=Klebsormidium nitens TaxID=105231 RepID=A0A1Y1HU41_KLENI|nr:Delta tubulin [Klebsormidium nitens]|eukprot:GAQ80036.1 Delta tubulin [Klebsormidium nitens]
MSVVTVQLGQCGNQVGGALFDVLAGEALSASRKEEPEAETFFRRGKGGTQWVARAVLVDMEPKALASTVRSARASSGGVWGFDEGRLFSRESGSGNNWARGFHTHGPACRDDILNLVRKEVEECDRFGGFLTLQSVAGGTGSGLGAYAAGCLRDEYPASPLLGHCVWPHESGEVIVQSYNAMLTLPKLAQAADGVILVENEALTATCRRLLNISRPSYTDLNLVAGRALACVLLPAQWRSEADSVGVGGARFRPLSDLVSAVCAHPHYPLLSLRALPQIPPASVDFTTFTWPSLVRQLRQMASSGAPLESAVDWAAASGAPSSPPPAGTFRSVNKSVSSLLVLRGKGASGVDVSSFASPTLYPSWAVDPLTVISSPTQFGKYEMATGLLSNCQTLVSPIERMLGRAYEMSHAGAYLHQYYQHGMSEASFEAAFASVEETLCHYRSL